MLNPQNPHHRYHPHDPSNKGYTLSEMVVVLGIMGILFAISTQSYLNQRDRFEFNAALTRMTQMIRTVRTYATSTIPVAVPGVGNIIPADGYGIRFDMSVVPGKSTFTIFANIGAAPDYMTDDEPNRFDDTDVVIESYTLPKQIQFSKLWFQTPECQSPLCNISAQYNKTGENKGPTALESIVFFKPPLADSWIEGFMVNDPENPKLLTNLHIEFENPEAIPGSAKKCLKIAMNAIKTFPELLYSNCQW